MHCTCFCVVHRLWLLTCAHHARAEDEGGPLLHRNVPVPFGTALGGGSGGAQRGGEETIKQGVRYRKTKQPMGVGRRCTKGRTSQLAPVRKVLAS